MSTVFKQQFTLLVIQTIILFLPLRSFSQDKELQSLILNHKKNEYLKSPLTNGFSGTWLWQNGDSQFKVVFITKLKSKVGGKDPYYLDFVAGRCIYIENGKQMINTINDTTKAATFAGTVTKAAILYLYFIEPYGEKRVYVTIKRVNSNEIEWIYKNRVIAFKQRNIA